MDGDDGVLGLGKGLRHPITSITGGMARYQL